ncbi:hypothetical protein ACDX66_01620 [Peribacillus frigoritolerans]
MKLTHLLVSLKQILVNSCHLHVKMEQILVKFIHLLVNSNITHEF